MEAGRVFQGRKFWIEKRLEPDASGTPRAYEVIRHPGAAVILPIMDDGRVVLIANHRISVDADLLELPAGTIDPPEDARTCAERELIEETGFRARAFEPLVSFYSSPGICDERMHVFVASGLTAGATALEAGERIVTHAMSFAEAVDAIRAGRIVDAKSIVALLFFDRFLKR